MEYKVLRSRRKTTVLTISKDKEVVVKAPLSLGEEKIRVLVRSHRPWLEKKLEQMERRERQEAAFLESGLFIFRGREYKTTLTEGSDIRLEDDRAFIGRDADPDLFYKEQLKHLTDRLEAKWRHEGSPSRISFKRQKSLWGSCSHNGEIRLNLLLAKAPLRVAEYVYLHELVHLKIRNHGPAFWQKVGELIPDYPEARKWLRLNGRYLFL